MGDTVLDPDQQAAVDHRRGACLVLAGPGSGKTRVIVERFLALCGEGVGPGAQLVLTYTIKAAGEMRERAERAHGPFTGEAPLLNFHAFGRRVLREWGWLAGVPAGFRIADRAERWLHAEAVLAELRPRTLWNPLRPHDLVDALLDLIEKAKQELVTPERYAAWAESRLAEATDPADRALLERHEECARVHAALAERHRRHAVLDHDDCILLADAILREHPAARRAVCGPLQQVMVDEFQDTNLAQARLVETLSEDHGNLLVVADDDQAIYKFRGASLANLDRFTATHPAHARITLSRNYRSTRRIVETCRALIESAAPVSRLEKRVEAVREEGEPVEVWEAADVRSETHAVAGHCRDLVEAGTRPGDIAWLFRRHDDMRPAMAALQEAGVPYRVHGGRGFFQQPEIKDLLGLLAAVEDPTDSQALIRCLHLPAWRVSSAGRLALVRAAASGEAPLCDLLRDPQAAATPGLDDGDLDAARRCAGELVELCALARHADVREVVFDAIERSGYVGALAAARSLERTQAGANLGKLADLLDAFADWAQDVRLGPALRYLSILRDSGAADEVAAIDPVEDGVVLLTAHGAKGLEWPVVIVGNCVEHRWPGRAIGGGGRLQLPDELVDEPAPEGDGHLDEERRLFYVAATRARDRLLFTWAHRTPSSFADERPTPFLRAVDAGPAAPDRRELPFVSAPPIRRRPVAGAPGPARVAPGVRDLRDFRDCPRRYEYRRRYRMPVRPSVQQWYGTLMHNVLERAGRLRHAGAEVDAEAVASIWAGAWDGSRPGYRGANPELRAYGEESLRRYAASPAWLAARPAAVEQPFTLRVDGGAITGRFDRVDAPRAAPPVVVDYKTGPPGGAEAAARDLQVRAYALALARQEQLDEVAVELHHLQTAEVVRVEFDAERLRRAAGMVGATAAELARAWEELRFPPNAAPFRCRRCEFRTICDEGRETAPVAAAADARLGT